MRGNGAAIDFRDAQTAIRMDINGSIYGDILGNGVTGNKINFAYQGAAANALFDGYTISGVEKLENWGNLSIIAKTEPSLGVVILRIKTMHPLTLKLVMRWI